MYYNNYFYLLFKHLGYSYLVAMFLSLFLDLISYWWLEINVQQLLVTS